jgi:hypothetical protein
MSSVPPLPEDVRRLIASDLAREEPPAAMRAQVLRQLEVGLGLALGAPAALLNAHVSNVASSKVGLGLATKLSLAAALSGAVVLGGWWLRPTTAVRSVVSAQSTARPVAGAIPVTPHNLPSLEPTVLSGPSASAPAQRVAVNDNLGDERRLLAAARGALQQHHLGQASALLAEHGRRFGAGRLGEERDRLLVQVAVVSGDASRARAQAETFVRRYPKSVYTPGIERLLKTLE